MGSLADTVGRRPVYMVAFSIYILANVGLAIQRSFPALLTLRMLQSARSSGAQVLTEKKVSLDELKQKQELHRSVMEWFPTLRVRLRGDFMWGCFFWGLSNALHGVILLLFISTNWYVERPNVVPPIGPLLGGAIADRLGWSYIFWFLCGLSGLCLLTITLSLPETARCIDGNGSISARGIIYKQWLPILRHVAVRNPAEVPQERRQPLRRLPNSIRSLRILLEKDSAIILFCNGIFYATYCCLQASLSSLFIALYDYGELQAGLVYIPFGVGCLIASLLLGLLSLLSSLSSLLSSSSSSFLFFYIITHKATGKLLDHDYARVAKAQNARAGNTRPNELENFPIEKARLRSIFYPVSVSVLVIIGYGWALEKRVVSRYLPSNTSCKSCSISNSTSM